MSSEIYVPSWRDSYTWANASCGPLQLYVHKKCRRPEAAIAVAQEMERINRLLQQIADRGDEIKDLRTRHELTVKRNTEASPSCSDWHAAHAMKVCA